MNKITITVDNYKGKKLTFTMPNSATIDMVHIKEMKDFDLKLTNITFEVMCSEGINFKGETIND